MVNTLPESAVKYDIGFGLGWEVFWQGCPPTCGMGDIGRDILDSFVRAQSLAATFRELCPEVPAMSACLEHTYVIHRGRGTPGPIWFESLTDLTFTLGL